MHRELAGHAARARFELETVDIDASEELVARYNHKVPVLTDADDNEICHYFLDLQALEAYFSTH
jgi:glutathione S-transferase